MPHDKKGRLIEAGDHLKFDVCERYDRDRQVWEKRATIGRAVSVTPGSETCNVQAVYLEPGYYPVKTETLTAKETELILKTDGSEPMDAPSAADEDPARFTSAAAGFGRIGAVVAVAVLALAALLAPVAALASAQERPARGEPFVVTVVAPSTVWTASLYSGTAAVLTRGEKKEFFTARATVGGPLFLAGLSGTARVEIGGTQDGGGLDLSRPDTFRTVEAGLTLYRRAYGRIDAALLGATTFSIEGLKGAPIDARLFTLATAARYAWGDGGYVYLGGGHVGPAGGAALLLSGSIPVKGGAFSVVDLAFPLQRTALRQKAWVLRAGAHVRVKTLKW